MIDKGNGLLVSVALGATFSRPGYEDAVRHGTLLVPETGVTAGETAL